MTANPDLPERKAPPRVDECDWFKRFPTGGTVYVQPPTVGSDVARLIRRGPNGGTSYTRPAGSNVEWFRRMPNGGGTVYTVNAGEESVLDDGEK